MKGGRYLEERHVKDVYDTIAPSFNDIPQKVWPNVKKFIKSLSPGSLVADIGCGNGRYLHLNNDVFKFGVDVCLPLVELSQEKGYEVLVADNQSLPFKENSFDAVISIGVLHHFSTEERRINGLRELCRILRPGGKLLIYVWAYEQKHRRFDGQDVLVPWHAGKKKQRPKDFFHSDQDISSTSSISEDESLGSSEKPYLQRTISDPACPCCPVRTPYNLIQSRQRSNTLPSSLEGLDTCHQENGQIEDECRKIQMSLKKMAASHNHGSLDSVFSNDNKVDFEEQIVFKSNCSESNLDNEIETCYFAGIKDENDVEQLSQSQQYSETTGFNQLPTQNSKKKIKKMSLFETLKSKLLKFINSMEDTDAKIDSGEERRTVGHNARVTSDTVGHNASVTSDQYNSVDEDVGKIEFAVREFPMSSYPADRIELNQPQRNENCKSIDIISNGHHSMISESLSPNSELELHESTHNLSEHNNTVINGISRQDNGLEFKHQKANLNIYNSNDSDNFSRQTPDSELIFHDSIHTQSKKVSNTVLTGNSRHKDDFYQKLNCDISTQKPSNIVVNGNSGHENDEDLKSHGTIQKLRKTIINNNSGHEGNYESQLHDSTYTHKLSNIIINGNSGHGNDLESKILESTQTQSMEVNKPRLIGISGNKHKLLKNKKAILNNTQQSSNGNLQGKLSYQHNNGFKSSENISSSTTTQSQLSHQHKNGFQSSENISKLQQQHSNGFQSSENISKLQQQHSNGFHSAENISTSCQQCNKLSQSSDNTSMSYQQCNELSQSSDNTSMSYQQCNKLCQSSDNISSSHTSLSCSLNGADPVPSKRLCRYYHVFREGELSTLINNHVNNLMIESCMYDHGNWCMILSKAKFSENL